MLNLLTNASKHTSEGSVTVHVESRRRDDADWIELAIRDTGEGMPPEIVSKLGQAFALNSGVVGDSHVQGSGLGLAICKGIVAAHGGSISVDTRLGEGTTVTVLLRADLDAPASTEEADLLICEV